MKIRSARFLRGIRNIDELPKDKRPLIGVCGRSNCGKSTLLNALTRSKGLAKVSRTPGRTQEINLFLCNDEFLLADLPGFGFAKVSRKKRFHLGALISEFVLEAPRLDGVIFLLDVRHEPSVHDEAMEELLREEGVPTVHVATKVDKVGKSKLNAHLKAIRTGLQLPAEAPIVPVSSLKKEGMKELLRGIHGLLHPPAEPAAEAPEPEGAAPPDLTP